MTYIPTIVEAEHVCTEHCAHELEEQVNSLLAAANLRAESLWKLLDDIDTLGDSMKPELTPYFHAVERIHKKRHTILKSDGYGLFTAVIAKAP